MRKLKKILFSVPALFILICVVVWAAQLGPVVDTNTLNEAFGISDDNDTELYGQAFDQNVIDLVALSPAANELLGWNAGGNIENKSTLTIAFERYISSEGLVPAGGFEHRFDFGTLTESKDFIVDDMATKDTAWIITDTGTAISVADGVQGYPVPSSWAGKSISSIIIVVDTAGVTGTSDFQIRRVRAGTPVDVLSTVATIDTTELTSVTAATPYVINTANDDMAEGDKLFIDVNAISTTPPQGASATIEVY